MQVRHILQIKGRDIIGVADSATLAEAARALAEHHIGVLVIQDSGGALAGIFSERDMVRAVAEDGPLALSRSIAHYMSRQVTTCRESDLAEELLEVMTNGRFRHVPVLDERHHWGGIKGTVSDIVMIKADSHHQRYDEKLSEVLRRSRPDSLDSRGRHAMTH